MMHLFDLVALLQLLLALLLALLCGGLLYVTQRSYHGWWQSWWQRAAGQRLCVQDDTAMHDAAPIDIPPTSVAGYGKTRFVSGIRSQPGNPSRLVLLLLLSIGLMSSLALIHLGIGTVLLTPDQLVAALLGQVDDPVQQSIIWSVRVPRLLVASVTGAMFGLAGVLLQTSTHNRLADAGSLGVASGGALLIVLWLIYVDPLVLPGASVLPLVGLSGCLLASLPLYILTRSTPPSIVGSTLVGLAISVGAPVIALLLLFPDLQVNTFLWWSIGSLDRRGWSAWQSLWPWALLALLLALLIAWMPALTRSGQPRSRMLWLGAAGIVTGSAVGVVGAVGYLGLLGSLLAQRIVGAEIRRVLLFSAIFGTSMLLLADIVARVISQAVLSIALVNELPAGLITMLIGLPYLLYVLIRRPDSVSKEQR